MREIKFRAWDVEEKRMFYPRVMEYTPGGGWWLLSENKFVKQSPKIITGFKKKVDFFQPLNGSNPESAPLMQYTGLKDKNGKEIYEGDIVKTHDRFIASIHFDFGKWMHITPLYDTPEEQMEVIGNIYENPELLAPQEPTV